MHTKIKPFNEVSIIYLSVYLSIHLCCLPTNLFLSPFLLIRIWHCLASSSFASIGFGAFCGGSTRQWRSLDISNIERRRLCCTVLFHCAAALCVIWSLCVLIERAADDVKRGLIGLYMPLPLPAVHESTQLSLSLPPQIGLSGQS